MTALPIARPPTAPTPNTPPAPVPNPANKNPKPNALRHGLTGQTVVLPSDDLAAYQRHSQSFLDEYQPRGATEAQLVQFPTGTSWRLNRIAALETNLFSLGITEQPEKISVNHPEAHDALAMALAFAPTSALSPTFPPIANGFIASSSAPSPNFGSSRPNAAPA